VPVNAIFADTDLPAGWEGYARIEREFFGPEVTNLGSPGGAADTGQIATDHPALAALDGAA
jgi:hypothetical protein